MVKRKGHEISFVPFTVASSFFLSSTLLRLSSSPDHPMQFCPTRTRVVPTPFCASTLCACQDPLSCSLLLCSSTTSFFPGKRISQGLQHSIFSPHAQPTALHMLSPMIAFDKGELHLFFHMDLAVFAVVQNPFIVSSSILFTLRAFSRLSSPILLSCP